MATMTTAIESYGRGVSVDLLNTVAKNDAVYADGFVGVAAADGESGDAIILDIEQKEYQFDVGTSLSVSKGDIVYVTLASVTAQVIPQSALSTTSGAGKKALFKATEARASTGIVRGVLLPQGA